MELTPQPSQPINTRSILIRILAGCIAVFGIWFIYHTLTTGMLTITTSEAGSSIVVSSSYSYKIGKKVKHSNGSLHARLTPGEYVVDVTNGSKRSSSTVTITARDTTEKSITLTASNDTETVANVPARSLAANGSSLIYLDGTDQTLHTIGVDNKVTSLGSNNTLATAQWLNRDYGLGIDPYNQFYEITGNNLETTMGEVTLPKGVNVNYSVAPNKDIYYSIEKDVYKYIPGQPPQKLYTADGDVQIEAGIDGLLVGVFSESQGASFSGKLVRINTKGVISSIQTQPYDVISWSPNSKNIVLAGASQSSIYSKSLTKIGSIPATKTISAPVWLNDNTLLYAIDDQIWKYDVKSAEAARIAQTSDGGSIACLKTSDDNGFVYAIVDGSSKKSQTWSITRTSLTDVKFSETAKKLQGLLPSSNTEYNIDYINFTRPTIYISPSQFGDLGTYKQSAIDYLKTNGINIDDVAVSN